MADSPRIEELKRRVQVDPASIAFAALAEEYRRAERFQEAIDTCAAGLVRHPSYLSAHVTLGRALMEVGRLQEAQQELEFVLKLAPENLAAIRGLAEIHHRLGDEQAHPLVVPSPTVEPARAPVAEAISVAEVQAASGFVVIDAAPPPAPPPVDPTLPVLEQLLGAIQRARATRAALR
jgi:tetratricopeptide (TPR) repeat protein